MPIRPDLKYERCDGSRSAIERFARANGGRVVMGYGKARRVGEVILVEDIPMRIIRSLTMAEARAATKRAGFHWRVVDELWFSYYELEAID